MAVEAQKFATLPDGRRVIIWRDLETGERFWSPGLVSSSGHLHPFRKGRKRKSKQVERPVSPYHYDPLSVEEVVGVERPPTSRDVLCRQLGYKSYRSYLSSDLWFTIRARVLSGACCSSCGGEANQVHHLSYSEAVLLGLDDSQLEAVCWSCHRQKDHSHIWP